MTRTAANGPSVGMSAASAQNPVDRQVGEAETPFIRFDQAKLSRPVDDPRALVGYGWAPGDYIGVCGLCKEAHISDKRAWRCQDCAEQARNAPPVPAEPAAPASDLEQVTRERDEAVRFVARFVRIYGDMQDGNGNTPTEIRHAGKFLASLRSMEKTGG